jgi:hypothetical protein
MRTDITGRPRRRDGAALRGRVGVGLAALLLVASTPVPAVTDAGWSVGSFTGGTVVAAVVPPPVIAACTLRREGLLNTVTGVIVTWRLPPGFTLTEAQLFRVTSGLALEPVTGFSLGTINTVTGADGTVTTTIPTTLLGSLLTLGSSTRFTFQVQRSGWTARADVLVTSDLLGISGCRPA